MSKIDDLSRLLHIRDAAIEAIDFVSGRKRDELNTNRMLTLALVKDIEIVGEAASRISAGCRARYPQLPWTQIIRPLAKARTKCHFANRLKSGLHKLWPPSLRQASRFAV